MRKWWIWSVIMALLLCGCHAAGAGADEAVGTYIGYEVCGADGAWKAMQEVYSAGENTLTLSAKGKGTLCLGGDAVSLRWTRADRQLTLRAGTGEYPAVLEGDCITMQMIDLGISLQFVREGAALPERGTEQAADETLAQEPAETTEQPLQADELDVEQLRDYLSGGWYGWYVISDASEGLADWVDSAWDICARIRVNSDRTGTIKLWDTDGESWQAVGSGKIRFISGVTQAGCMISEGGTFLDGPVARGDWSVDPGISDVTQFSHMICLTGTQTGESSSWICYRMYLRPWGSVWDDVRQGDTSEAMYADLMPIGYDTWYLPLVEAGEAMPKF